jgi:hypothetical protein
MMSMHNQPRRYLLSQPCGANDLVYEMHGLGATAVDPQTGLVIGRSAVTA